MHCNYPKPFFKKKLLLKPRSDVSWASWMVLNPAIIRDPQNEKVLHMLFRTCGPCPEKQLPGKLDPYPIYLAYAVSHNEGEDWKFDFSSPALAPTLEYERTKVLNPDGSDRHFANGCVEDPRLFYFEEKLYLSVACRVFPPGPYWECDDPFMSVPLWGEKENDACRAVRNNITVSLLYSVSLGELASGNYEKAFVFICPLSSPDSSDNRDVFLFPRRLNVNGKQKIVCIHRPLEPRYFGMLDKNPSIFFAVADRFEDFSNGMAEQYFFAGPELEWEENRVGASWPPIELTPGEWLFPYHGKKDGITGYTQSFMLLKENADGTFPPEIISRPEERLLFADQPWELDGKFRTPCLFTCSGVVISDDRLLCGYGAADTVLGLAETSLSSLVEYLRHCAKK